MARTRIPDLWSPDIQADVLTPTMILKAQARALTKRTKGLLVASVEVENAAPHLFGKKGVLLVLRLDIVAAACENQRFSLFSVAHYPGSPYPAALICPSKEVAEWVRRSKSLSEAP